MLFFQLLQIAIGNKEQFSQAPTVEEWHELYVLAQKQAMMGIAFRGVERLPEAQRPPKSLLKQWYMVTEHIKSRNADLDRKALAVANKFLLDGFPGIVLKGQGIAQLYQVELDNEQRTTDNDHPEEEFPIFNSQFSIKKYRTPGDIDIWLKGDRKTILTYVRRHVTHCKPVYHHVDFPVIDGLDIEIHFTPTWMNSPITNHRLQRWFRDYAETAFSSLFEDIPVPNVAFNRVYILVHIYRHLFAEGIGLRQLLDYYYVLLQGCTEEERIDTMRMLRSLKMQRFAGAVMWVLQHVFAMDDRYLLTAPNACEGHFLLAEIMKAGNFGQYDERLQHEQGVSALQWGWRKVKRNFRFVRSYPSEVLWSPLFKLWHWGWRKRTQKTKTSK